MEVLTHYTSFINMLHIIENYIIIFGDLKRANDLTEYNNYSEDNISCFAFCCCEDEFNAFYQEAYDILLDVTAQMLVDFNKWEELEEDFE